MAIGIGLNRMDDAVMSDLSLNSPICIELETKRRVWWSCFIVDRLCALCNRIPLCIDDRDCVVRFPAADDSWLEGIQILPGAMFNTEQDNLCESRMFLLESPVNGSSCYIRLCTLAGRIASYLNRPKSRFDKSAAVPGSEFATLDLALSNWQEGVFADEYQLPKIPQERYLFTFYHCLSMMLHRSNLPLDGSSPKSAFSLRSYRRVKSCALSIVDATDQFLQKEKRLRGLYHLFFLAQACDFLSMRVHSFDISENEQREFVVALAKGTAILEASRAC